MPWQHGSGIGRMSVKTLNLLKHECLILLSLEKLRRCWHGLFNRAFHRMQLLLKTEFSALKYWLLTSRNLEAFMFKTISKLLVNKIVLTFCDLHRFITLGNHLQQKTRLGQKTNKFTLNKKYPIKVFINSMFQQTGKYSQYSQSDHWKCLAGLTGLLTNKLTFTIYLFLLSKLQRTATGALKVR